jgi:U3 small nucleolar RNA-associated protein 14
MNHLTPEEVQARRAELRQMRELMFRAEAKAKRVSKIKSKTYRRIRKKERAKLAEKLGDAEGGDMDEEEVQLKREVERARERATLRHKHTGKWAKSLKGRSELGEDQQRDLNEMLDRGEKLRRRIQGIGRDEDHAGSDSDTNSEAEVEDLKASAFDELHALRTQAESEPSEGAAKKSVFNMKFMKDSMAAGMQNVNDSIDHLINDLEGDGIAAGSEAPDDTYRGHGRVSFHPGQRVGQSCISCMLANSPVP